MAIGVMNWVLEDAPDLPAHCFGVLMALASKANEDGTAARPGQKWLAERARKSDRQVRSDLAKLEELKLIRRGDQSLVAHLPADERPIVWDLAIERIKSREMNPKDGERDRKRTSGRKPASARNEEAEEGNTGSADQRESERDRKRTSARKPTSGRNFTSGGERKWASDNTSFDKSSSSPSEKRDARTRARTTVEGARLLAEHISACRLPPSKELSKQTSEEIDKLLAEDHITADHIRGGLALLRAKPHLSPRLLQNLVFEAANKNVAQLPATGTDGPRPVRTGALANVNDLWKR